MKIFKFIMGLITELISGMFMVCSIFCITKSMGVLGASMILMFTLADLLNTVALKLMERSKKDVSKSV